MQWKTQFIKVVLWSKTISTNLQWTFLGLPAVLFVDNGKSTQLILGIAGVKKFRRDSRNSTMKRGHFFLTSADPMTLAANPSFQSIKYSMLPSWLFSFAAVNHSNFISIQTIHVKNMKHTNFGYLPKILWALLIIKSFIKSGHDKFSSGSQVLW